MGLVMIKYLTSAGETLYTQDSVPGQTVDANKHLRSGARRGQS